LNKGRTPVLIAALGFSDFALIAAMLAVVAGGRAAASAYLPPAERDKLQRVEQKLDLILAHLGIDYVPPSKASWQELADDPKQKINAIRAYREEHGVGLAEAKKAVEDYILGMGA
jgi:ribosomal protein L7/L12